MKLTLIPILFLFFLSSCNFNEIEQRRAKNTNTEDESKENYKLREAEERENAKCNFKKDKNKTVENSLPFSKATKIEAITFDFNAVMKDHDELRKKKIKTHFDSSSTVTVIKNGYLFLNHIKHRQILTEEQVKSLFEILIFYKGNDFMGAKCHKPNHVLVFYEKEVAIAFLELCFSCNNFRQQGCSFDDFCYEKWEDLKNFFPKETI